MWRPARQRKAVVAVGLALIVACFGAAGVHASETKLLAECGPPTQSNETSTFACELRATGPAEFQDIKARIEGADIESRFEPFDAEREGSTTAYLMQTLPAARRATLSQMADAVVSIADRRDGQRRFTAYTFADALTAVADSGVSRDAFVRQLIAVGAATGPTHIYAAAREAVAALAKETGARKSLVILADGTSDDTDTTHDHVVEAAREAGVTIHVLGYYDDARQRSKFEALSRLAEETGGYAAEVKRGSGAKNDFTKEIVTSRFLTDIVENGGMVTAVLDGPAGTRKVAFTATLADGKSLSAEADVTIPEAPRPPPRAEPTASIAPPAPELNVVAPSESEGRGWLLLLALGAFAGLGIAGYVFFGKDLFQFVRWWIEAEPRAGANAETDTAADASTRQTPALAAPQPAAAARPARAGAPSRQRSRDGERRSVVYGWLETLDGDAARHPLRSVDVRVGRHRDNDICLANDSISRRHAAVRYDAKTRRFTITDLGAGNGVIVNKTRYKSRELNDGDTVELGEVRLRFRTEPNFQS
ncbi:FHA domain-containing protein [Hyphomicrobium sp.]|uniref:FHA domain-containing protein n=1 Tax=Hyphomicrobium sp. TaxID=82 RepID=UPI002D1DC64F|nr:FHA domain-containing protein [Hyphomicrobium sp.]HRN89063.1 FHA domain-containing protein [Hyphomicrobium sp.]HRQ27658.1 FHA domain-containing protein [Hyphomicrobium sp.]